MKGFVFILCVFTFFTSCSPLLGPQSYLFELDSKLLQDSTLINKGIKYDKKYIPVSRTTIKDSDILNYAFSMLQKGQSVNLTKLKRFLKTQDTSLCEVKLALLYYYMAKNKFDLAQGLYPTICKDSLHFSEELIYADLQLELALCDGSLDYDRQLAVYQELINKYISDELAKKIVKSRARRLRFTDRN